MIPITRIERYLAQISQDPDANGIDDPVTRLEYYLAKIAGESVTLPERPITRLEMYLAKIAGESNGIPDAPVTRVEMYLAAIAGESVQPPEPITRVEMYLAKWNEGGSGTITTVTGLSPLALVNALAKPIKKLIQYGKVTAVDGEMFCNNGKLVAVHRSGLPSGYTLLDSVGGSGSQWVITDTYLASTDVVECEFRNSTTTGYGAVYGIFRAGDSSALYGNQTYYGYDVSNNKVDTGIPVDTDWHASRHDFANGTLTIDDTTVTYTPFEFENSTKNAVLSRYYNNSYGYGWKGYVRKFKVTRGNEVICDLLPCKNDQDVAGFYDLAAEKFYAPTSGALLEGNVVDDYELAVVGTPEVLSVGAQTASVVNLYAVGNVKDEQNIISGVVTRRTEVSVSGGVVTVTALAEPVIEHVTAQPIRTAEGTNTIAVTSEVDPVELSVEYTASA